MDSTTKEQRPSDEDEACRGTVSRERGSRPESGPFLLLAVYEGHARLQRLDLGPLLLRRHKVALLSAVGEPQARGAPGDDGQAEAGAVEGLQVLVGSFVTP